MHFGSVEVNNFVLLYDIEWLWIGNIVNGV